MNQEKGVVFLTSLVAVGIACVSFFAVLCQTGLVVPFIIFGIFAAGIILFANKGNFSHKIESLEKVFFIVTFLIIVIAFILLYKPI